MIATFEFLGRARSEGGCTVIGQSLVGFSYEKNKFTVSGLTAVQSHRVLPTRIDECPLQIEAKVVDIRLTGESTRFGVIEVEAVTVHAHEAIVLDDSHINASAWSPLIYNFRHYFRLSEKLRKTFRAEV